MWMRDNGVGNRRPYQRHAVGFTYMNLSGVMKHREYEARMDLYDSTFESSVKGRGLGVVYATFFPIARMSQKSLIAIALGLNVNFSKFKGSIDSVIISTPKNGKEEFRYEHDGSGLLAGMPIGIDFITGGEATLDKSNKYSFTLGAGVLPVLVLEKIGDWEGGNASFPTYFKAEVGAHFGINWKFRVMYISKSLSGFSNVRDSGISDKGPIYVSEVTYSAKDQFMFSILLMPFSWDWEQSGW